MGELLGLAIVLALLAWLGKFVVGEGRRGRRFDRVFWVAVVVACVGFLGLYLYAAGQPNW